MESLQHHLPYLAFILLGALIYALSGVAKFKARKGTGWTIRKWWMLNGVNTLLGLVAAVAIYAVTVTQFTALSYGACLALGLGLDIAANRLSMMLGPKKLF